MQAELKGTRRTAGIGVKSGVYSGTRYRRRQKTVVAASIHSAPLRDFDENGLKHWRFPTGSRELRRECGRAMRQCPWTRSVRAARDPAKLAKTPGLNQDEISKIEQGTDTDISSLAGYLEALADKLANPRYFPDRQERIWQQFRQVQ